MPEALIGLILLAALIFFVYIYRQQSSNKAPPDQVGQDWSPKLNGHNLNHSIEPHTLLPETSIPALFMKRTGLSGNFA